MLYDSQHECDYTCIQDIVLCLLDCVTVSLTLECTCYCLCASMVVVLWSSGAEHECMASIAVHHATVHNMQI